MVKMALTQLFKDMFLPSNSKLTYCSLNGSFFQCKHLNFICSMLSALSDFVYIFTAAFLSFVEYSKTMLMQHKDSAAKIICF